MRPQLLSGDSVGCIEVEDIADKDGVHVITRDARAV